MRPRTAPSEEVDDERVVAEHQAAAQHGRADQNERNHDRLLQLSARISECRLCREPGHSSSGVTASVSNPMSSSPAAQRADGWAEWPSYRPAARAGEGDGGALCCRTPKSGEEGWARWSSPRSWVSTDRPRACSRSTGRSTRPPAAGVPPRLVHAVVRRSATKRYRPDRRSRSPARGAPGAGRSLHGGGPLPTRHGPPPCWTPRSELLGLRPGQDRARAAAPRAVPGRGRTAVPVILMPDPMA